MSGKTYPIDFLLGVKDLGSVEFARGMGRMQSSAERMSRLGTGLTAAVTLPILGMAVASDQAAVAFEDKMANIGTIIDTNAESLDELGQRVLGLKRLPVPLGDMADALYDVRSAGTAASDQFKVLEGSAKLGVAGLGSTKEAADIATSAINGFHLEGEAARKLYDNIFLTTQFGKTTIAGLAQGFGSVAATVASTGTELDEYLSMVAALTTTGLPAAEAHTQIKAAISGLTRPTKENVALFRQLGAKDLPTLIKQAGGLTPALRAVADVASANSKIYQKLGARDFPDLIKKSGGFVEALAKLEKAGDKNSAAILKSVGSTEALNAVLSLTGPVAETQAAALDKMRNSEGALEDAFAKKAATRAAQRQALRNDIEATAISIGDQLVPAVQSVTTSVQGMLKSFDGLSDGDKKIAAWSAATVASIGPVLKTLSAVQTHPVIAAGLAGAAVGAYVGEVVGEGVSNLMLREKRGENDRLQKQVDEVRAMNDAVAAKTEAILAGNSPEAMTSDQRQAKAAELFQSLRTQAREAKSEIEVTIKTPPGVTATTETKPGGRPVNVKTGKTLPK